MFNTMWVVHKSLKNIVGKGENAVQYLFKVCNLWVRTVRYQLKMQIETCTCISVQAMYGLTKTITIIT